MGPPTLVTTPEGWGFPAHSPFCHPHTPYAIRKNRAGDGCLEVAEKEIVYLNFLLEKKEPTIPATPCSPILFILVRDSACQPPFKSYNIAVRDPLCTRPTSTFLSSPNMSSMNLAAKQQTAATLLPVGGQRGQVQHHEGAAGFADGGCASEGGLQEVGELSKNS